MGLEVVVIVDKSAFVYLLDIDSVLQVKFIYCMRMISERSFSASGCKVVV